MKRVLIVKTSSMGDVIHALPALTDAAQALGAVEFDWVVEEAFREIPAWHAQVNRVIPIALRRWRKTFFDRAVMYDVRAEIKDFFSALKLQQYDAVVDLQGLLKSAWITRAAQAKRRCGYSLTSAREPLASIFYKQHFVVAKALHAVERNRELLAQALAYAPVTIGAGEYAIKHNFPVTASNEQRKTVVFVHGTSRDDKCWPRDYWKQLAQLLAERGFDVLLPWGSEQERQRALAIADGNQHVEVLDRLSLTQLANYLRQAHRVVSVDTGLGHLAAAIDCQSVVLYGPTSVELVGAYGANQTTLVSRDKTMASLRPAQVLDALAL